MHFLYATNLDRARSGAHVHATRGIRSAQEKLGLPHDLRPAMAAAEALRDNRIAYILVGQHESFELVTEAASILSEYSEGAVTAGIDLSPDDLADLEAATAARRDDPDDAPEITEDDPELQAVGADPDAINIDLAPGALIPSVPAAQTALVLMAAAGGSPAKALIQAGLLARSTTDPDKLYRDTQILLCHTFPALLGPSGPPITIIG